MKQMKIAVLVGLIISGLFFAYMSFIDIGGKWMDVTSHKVWMFDSDTHEFYQVSDYWLDNAIWGPESKPVIQDDLEMFVFQKSTFTPEGSVVIWEQHKWSHNCESPEYPGRFKSGFVPVRVESLFVGFIGWAGGVQAGFLGWEYWYVHPQIILAKMRFAGSVQKPVLS